MVKLIVQKEKKKIGMKIKIHNNKTNKQKTHMFQEE
jgi:hypothetical protein